MRKVPPPYPLVAPGSQLHHLHSQLTALLDDLRA